MAQLFPRWLNYLPQLITVGVLGGLVGAVFAVWYWFSPWYTDVGYRPPQPIPFSHKLHAGDLGLDCRYCHNTVEVAPHAAIPPTQTCMNCHKSVLPDSLKLVPLRTSDATGAPVEWTRVHMLPDYAFFDHSVHLAAGVGCVSCHGRVDQMHVVQQAKPLSMSWCLDCHRDPAPNLRPQDKVTDMAYDPAAAAYDPAKDPHRSRSLSKLSPPLHCSGCHR